MRQRDLATTIERFRSAVEALPEGMVILDAANRIEWANARAQAHLGIDLAKDAGQPLLNFVRQPEVVRYFEAGDFADSVVVDSQREPGTTLSIQVVPFGVDERLLISRNITQIEAVARMRRDFIANVSHELKTPLTVVSGFLETLQDMELEPRQRTRYLQLMTRAGEQHAAPRRRPADACRRSRASRTRSRRHVVRGAPAAARSLGRREGAVGRPAQDRRSTSAEPAIVTGNRDELASAFGNLVSNAVRYTPDGGTITLGWHVDDEGRGAFSVADTGIGIAPEHIPRLTERFYRVDRSRSRATRRHGSRARDRQARAAAAPGRARRDERAGQGQHVHGDAAGASASGAPDADSPGSTASPVRRVARRLPVAERGAEQRLQVVAPDVLRRVADHAVLRLGAGGERIEMRRVEAERRQAVGHRRRAHQFDHATGEHVAGIGVRRAARFGAEALRAVQVPLGTAGRREAPDRRIVEHDRHAVRDERLALRIAVDVPVLRLAPTPRRTTRAADGSRRR